MTRRNFSRRHLLQAGCATAGLAALAGRLSEIRESAAADLKAGRMADGRPSRELYGLAPGLRYLNHASIGSIPAPVRMAHAEYLNICETNPWLHIWGGAWEEPRERVRAAAARYLGCPAGSLAITHNTTEGFNLAAQGLMLHAGDEVLFPHINHPGASVAWDMAAKRGGFRVRRFRFPLDDIASLTAADCLALYDDIIRPQTRVLVLPDLDNIVGFRQPVAKIAALARRRGVEFIAVDGAQSAGMLPLEIEKLDVDLYATSGHKWLQGPKGTGLLYLSEAARERLRPLWTTWGQERWADSIRIFEDYGTRNFPALLALGDAIDFQTSIDPLVRAAHYEKLRRHAMARADASSALDWYSPRDRTLGGSLFALALNRETADDAFARLSARKFVFRPFRPPDPNVVRISPNLTDEIEDIDRLIDALEAA